MADSNEPMGHNDHNPKVEPTPRELVLLEVIKSLLFVVDTLFHLQGVKAAGQYGILARQALDRVGLRHLVDRDEGVSRG